MTDISIDGDVLFQDIEPGKRDSLGQAELAKVAGRDNQSDYVERGFALSYNGSDNTLDVTSGAAGRNHAVVRDGADAYDVFPADETGLTLPTSTGTAYVYLAIDPTVYDSLYYHIDTDQTPPADPSLFIGTVDTGAGTTSTAKRDPEMSARAIDAEAAVTETLDDKVGGANWLGMDPSMTHYRYVSLTRDEVFKVPWMPDHRNPVMNDPHWRAEGHEGHTGGAIDPRADENGLVCFSEGFTSKVSGEDTYLSRYDSHGLHLTSPAQYIGNGADAGRRVAPRVLYVPEQQAFVMFHGSYPKWDYGISTSTDMRSWSRATGADPILSDVGPHTEAVRVGHQFYIFINDGTGFGYRTLPVDDLTAISSHNSLSLPNQSGNPSGSLVRCKDGWLWLGTDGVWGSIRAWETTFSDFPTGWTERAESPDPFGLPTSDTWNAGGYRNPTMLEVGGVPMLVVPATKSSGATADSQTAFWRAGVDTTGQYTRTQAPHQLHQGGYSTSNTSFERIGWVRLPLDPKAAADVLLDGVWDITNSGTATTTVRLYDVDAAATLVSKTNGTHTFRNVSLGDVSKNNYQTNLLKMEMKVSDGTTTGTLRMNQGFFDFVHRLGRQVHR